MQTINGRSAVGVTAFAKINLTLDVCGKRPDGYHEITSVMHQTGLCDKVILEREKGEGITLKVESASTEDESAKAALSHELVPDGSDNIAYKAAALILEKAAEKGIEPGHLGIKLVKKIPAAAGLAGGSTDAAAVLTGVNKLLEGVFSEEELCSMGVSLGADVPFCIKGGCALCSGIGEKMTRLSGLSGMPIVLVKPPVEVKTGPAYKLTDEWESEGKLAHPDSKALAELISSGKVEKASDIAGYIGNSFMAPVSSEFPVIADIINKLKEAGGTALMSGSGPTVFALFDDRGSAYRTAEEIGRSFKDAYIYNGVLM